MECSRGPTESKAGTCAKISANRGGKKNGYIWSRTYMDWYSVQNFCDAQDKDMVTVESLKCYSDGTANTPAEGNSNYGYCCKANGTTCGYDQWTAGGDTRANAFSAEIVALKETVGTDNGYWTQSVTNDSCSAFSVSPASGHVGSYTRYNDEYALCE